MPAMCRVCTHAERDAIDEALVSRVPYRNITQLYGVSKYSLSRHLTGHILPYVARVRERQDHDRAGTMVARINELTSETRDILRAARTGEDRDLDIALKAITRLERQLELEAKIEKVINEGAAVNINLNSQWLELKAMVVGALAPHPDARRDVLKALEFKQLEEAG